MQVLIVDDSRSSLMHLKALALQAGAGGCETVTDADLALQNAATRRYDLLIVDHIMPKMDGITFTRAFRTGSHHRDIPILMVTGTSDDDIRLEALEAGATDFLTKSGSQLEIRVKIKNLLSLSAVMRKLDHHVETLSQRIEDATQVLLAREEEMIFRLSKAVEYRDNDTGDHTVRVARYSRTIAEGLGLPADLCRSIYLAAPLHDIGKVAIPDSILLKPGRLDDAEMAVIRTHATTGEEILAGSSSELLRLSAEIAGHHHEKWDGTGYPYGKAGSAIPLSARIVAVADVFDALTTQRAYKKAMPFDEAMDYLAAQSGKHFDPACVEAFLKSYQGARAA
jgi:putative two-component system response regulator